MFLSVVLFWLTYFGVGCYLNNKNKIQFASTPVSQHMMTTTIMFNILLSFVSLPFLWFVPTLVVLPDMLLSYPLRWLLATLFSDVWLYISHRLFHMYFYNYHKLHHQYVNPSALATFVVHPYEFIASNWLSMMIPLLVISYNDLLVLGIRVVCISVLYSH